MCKIESIDKYEYRITRDLRIPLVDGDEMMDYGWRNIPMPPTLDQCWAIWDDSSDRKTVWRRPRHGPAIHWGEPYSDEKKPFDEDDDRRWRVAAAHQAA